MLDISPADVRPNRFPSGCCAGRSVTRASHGFLYSYLIRWCSYELRPVITGAAPSRYRVSRVCLSRETTRYIVEFDQTDEEEIVLT